ncbi:MAG: hypothetical protein KF841_07040 [Phycisphaerae bacterium]|nr:hypothetical protein [Phycisphaerae bacterium]
MTDPREHLEFLIARATDGDLTGEEREIISKAVANDTDLADEIRRYERVNAVIANWRTVPHDMDWAGFRRSVSDAVTDDAMATVDETIRGVVGSMPPVDWDAFRSRVSSAVRAEAVQTGRAAPYRMQAFRHARWLAPLAAAAAIAIAVFRGGFDPQGVVPTGVDREPSLLVVSLDVPESTGKIAVMFDESPAPEMVAEIGPSSAFVSTGGALVIEDVDDGYMF